MDMVELVNIGQIDSLLDSVNRLPEPRQIQQHRPERVVPLVLDIDLRQNQHAVGRFQYLQKRRGPVNKSLVRTGPQYAFLTFYGQRVSTRLHIGSTFENDPRSGPARYNFASEICDSIDIFV